MKRIIVIGSGGSGKSTLARRLGPILGIDVIHLDTIYWSAGWQPMPDDKWAETVKRLTKRESWIMDGNFGGTREIRMAACDTIIWLDMPRSVCLYRVLKRRVTYRRGSRPDMAEGCNERLDWDFLKWIWNYPKRRPALYAQFNKFPDKRLIILRSDLEIENFLISLAEAADDGMETPGV
jgi:adenylate kinase family enzyme